MKLKEAVDILSKAEIADPLREARLIFSQLSGLKQYELLSPEAVSDSESLTEAVYRRAKREPLQYILGKAYFYRECYKVTNDVLIPREDTEILVDYAVKSIPRGSRFLDLCTGSGCIALSVLNNTEKTTAIAVDLSEKALEIAKENSKELNLSSRVSFIHADATKKIDGCGKFFAVLSNPPYVTKKAYDTLEKEIYFEPRMAFVGGEDGGDFYRQITPIYKDMLEDGGFIAYEIGYDQGELIQNVAREHGMIAEIIKDFSQNDRVAVLRKQKDPLPEK